MRIASSGGPSDHRDANSLEGDARSLDPDHEPRKEGGPSKAMKQSPSVVDINGEGHQSDGENKGRSPQGGSSLPRGLQNTDHSDDDYNSRSGVGLRRDDKHTRSNRKIKPMYALNGNQASKGMLKVVHEDEHSSANEGMIPYLNKGN